MNSQSQRGVALVLTLIMLSVITVLALAFLSVTRQERHSVEHSGYASDTEQMVEAALARAKVELLSTILATTNPAAPPLLVSVNIDGNGVPMTLNPPVLQNLLYDLRTPVFINTNRNPAGPVSNDWRYYVDLNRNGFFDDTGWLPVFDSTGNAIVTNDAAGNLLVVSNYFTGDPQWIGVLSDSARNHSPSNYLLGRYAYLAVPIGQTLDLNFIHNNAKYSSDRSIRNGYHREQGVGFWEINMAAFLADLNTNVWAPRADLDFIYQEDPASVLPVLPSSGLAFNDAHDLLLYRYLGSPARLTNLVGLLNPTLGLPVVDAAFRFDEIDQYGDGLAVVDDPMLPWPGADSPRHFYTLHDLWQTNNYPSFVSRLREASETNRSSYDQYTFYRLLSEIGTDSEPEPEDLLGPRVNLNFDNFNSSTTNLQEWAPIEQFSAIADRLLREDAGLTVTNIPVFTNMSSWSTNTGLPLYSGRVHQLIQLAANIADATRTGVGVPTDPNAFGEQFQYPTVYKPIFEQRGSDVFIVSFEALDGQQFRTDLLAGRYTWHDLDNPSDRPDGTGTAYDQYYGVPMIVSARKGHPNFNEAAMETVIQVSRKLEFIKRSPQDRYPYQTNQMFILGISNVFGVEAWNSYLSNYPGPVQMLMVHNMSAVLTNDTGLKHVRTFAQNNFGGGMSNVVMAGAWKGRELRVPSMRSTMTLTNSVYYEKPTPRFVPVAENNVFESGVASYTNKWGLSVSNRLQFFMFEARPEGRLIDAVTLGDLNTYIDLSDRLAREESGATDPMWDPRPYGNVSRGVLEQILVSANQRSQSNPVWTSYDANGNDDKAQAQERFRQFIGLGGAALSDSLTRVMLAPYSPTKRLSQLISWQVNDPLVHYRTEDLLDTTNIVRVKELQLVDSLEITNFIGRMNTRYRPWGGEFFGDSTSTTDPNDTNPSVKDPGVRSSDFWDFPTNKINLGDLGRVHRGTPWQTVYLKSGRATAGDWASQLGAGYSRSGFQTAPTNDWRLLSHFTTAPHPNAELGKLSVNQPGLAAWSAVLSGVPVRRAASTGLMTNTVIRPYAAGDPAVAQIVEGINRERAVHPFGRFERVGDVFATPELTDASPFLPAAADARNFLTEEEFEQIPRRIASLLSAGSSRYAVYAFGQSLRPAPNSIILAGADRGLCTNYQVTGESAVRALVRIEFDPLSLDPSSTNFNKPDWNQPRVVVESYNLVPIE